MSGQYVVVRPDGTLLKEVEPGKGSRLEKLQGHVEGYIQRVRVRYDGRVRDAYVNEDGIADRLAPNRMAMNMLVAPFSPLTTLLVGNMVIWVPDAKVAKKAA